MLKRLLLIFGAIQITVGIYTPGESTTKPPFTKTTWRKIAIQPPDETSSKLIVHHNYSKVFIHGHGQEPHTHQMNIIDNARKPMHLDDTAQTHEKPYNQYSETRQEQLNTGETHHYVQNPTQSGQSITEIRQSKSYTYGPTFPDQSVQESSRTDQTATNHQQSNWEQVPNGGRYDSQKIIHDKLTPIGDKVKPVERYESSSTQQGQGYTIHPSVYTIHPTFVKQEISSTIEEYPYRRELKSYSNMAFEQCPKNVTGQLVYLWSCSQFLNCWKGRGVVQNCAPGTLFNPESLECDYPHKVQCISGAHNQKVGAIKLDKSESEQNLCSPNFAGLLAHPTDCTKFINCAYGKAVVQDCGPGTAFNVKILACDHPHVTGCEIKQEEYDTTPYPYVLTQDNIRMGSGREYITTHQNYGQVVQPGNYIQRQWIYSNRPTTNSSVGTQHLPTLKEVQVQHQYGNQQAQTSGQELYAGAHHGQSTYGSTQGASTTSCHPHCQDQSGQGQVHTQNSGYGNVPTQGTSTTTYVRTCHPHCQDQFGQTQPPYQNSGHGNTPTQGTWTTSYVSGQTQAQNQNSGYGNVPTQGTRTTNYVRTCHPHCQDQSGQTQIPNQNSGYVVQYTGQAHQTTPVFPTSSTQTLASDQTSGYVVHTGQAHQNPPVFPTPSAQTCNPPCPNHQSSQTLLASASQRNERQYGQTGRNINNTTYTWHSGSHQPPSSSSTSSSTSQQTASVKCPERHTGLLPHPYKCEKFLNCVNGGTFIQDCGPGTVFNPETKVCDWPYNVKCQNRSPTLQTNVQHQTGTGHILVTRNQSTEHYRPQQGSQTYGPGHTLVTVNSEQNYQTASSQPSHTIIGQSNLHHQTRPGYNYVVRRNQSSDKPATSTQFYRPGSNQQGQSNLNQHKPGYTYIITRNQSQGETQHGGQVYRPVYTVNTNDQNYQGGPSQQGQSNLNQPQPGFTYIITRNQSRQGETQHGGQVHRPVNRNDQNYQSGPSQQGQFTVSGQNSLHYQPQPGYTYIVTKNQSSEGQIQGGQIYRPVSTNQENYHTASSQHSQTGYTYTTTENQNMGHNTPVNQSPGRNYESVSTHTVTTYGQSQYPSGVSTSGQKPTYSGVGIQPHGNTGIVGPSTHTSTIPQKPDLSSSPTQHYQFTQITEGTSHGVPNVQSGYQINTYSPAPTQQSRGTQTIHQTPAGSFPASNVHPARNTQTTNETHHDNNPSNTRLEHDSPFQPEYEPGLNQHMKPVYKKPSSETRDMNIRPEPPAVTPLYRPNTITQTLSTSINVHNSSRKIGSKHWPPPFPSTDTSADYFFEDTTPKVTATKNSRKTWKSGGLCPEGEFECSEIECIPQKWVCDGTQDCASGLDEKNCTIHLDKFTMIPNSRLFKHEIEKWLNTDLQTCAKYCLNSENFLCKSFNFRRNDNVCLLSNTNVGLSGALSTSNQYDYYEITATSVDCTNMYECSNKKCINYTQVCDGKDDCGNRMDEKNCSAESLGYAIKLAGSQFKTEGRIEIKVFDEWGFICDDQFGLRNADVACKELGFSQGALEIKSGSYFARDVKDNETYYLMDDVHCFGNETSLRDCIFNGWGVHNCMPQEIVGVVCKTPQEVCPKNHWKCDTTKECLPLQFVCDGVFDCEDRSDEGSQHCDAPIQLRLENGTAKNEGRVEVRYHGVWGTICDDDFTDQAAKVICQSLGYHGNAVAKKDGAFGPGEGPIWLDQLNCFGNESFFEDCSHWNWGEHNCEHSEDAGVVCSNVDTSEFEKKSKTEDTLTMEAPNTAMTNENFSSKCGHRGDDLFSEDENENSDIHFRVVKASVARKGDYPWQATIRVRGKSKSSHWCGAVVISNKYILTAAHCLVGFSKGSYIVRAGDYNVDEEEGTEVEAFIEDFYVHEKFRQGGHMNNDIALIRLKGSGLKLSKHVQPICLPEADTDYRVGMNCTISGFGSTETGKSASSHVLRAGWVTLRSQEICKMPQIYGESITDGMICAGSLDEGVDSCDGDSGGPLACLNKGLFTLYGLTSWGQRCGQANKPGVYVKVSHYRDWIDKIIEETS